MSLKLAQQWCASVHNADTVSRDILELMIRAIQADALRHAAEVVLQQLKADCSDITDPLFHEADALDPQPKEAA